MEKRDRKDGIFYNELTKEVLNSDYCYKTWMFLQRRVSSNEKLIDEILNLSLEDDEKELKMLIVWKLKLLRIKDVLKTK